MKCLRSLIVSAALAGLATAASAAGFTGLYIFGDSLSDSGNVAAAIGSDPAQVIAGNSYIPSRPYASGQFTNGDVWAKTFAGAIGLAPFAQPSLAGGGNFAFGGARVATDGPGMSPSLQAQTSLFLGAFGGFAPQGALYVVEGGGNDARDAFAAAAVSATPGAVIAAAAAAYAQKTGAIVDQLQAAGARHLVVWDVPNLALAPAILAQGAGASFLGGQLSLAMNGALAARLAGESDVALFDLFGIQSAFVASPAAFGLTNVTDACGAPGVCDPAKALYWDGIHPSAAVHRLLAREMVVTVVPEPATTALFIGGLLLLGAYARRRRA